MSAERRHGLLGVGHGFAAPLDPPPAGLVRPIQVHGVRVVAVEDPGDTPGEADAIFTTRAGLTVGIVSADCVPVLARAESGAAAAIHAGWRGLAAGVLEAGIAALAQAGSGGLRAVVGPSAAACCYEVDAPVLDALAARYGAALEAFAKESRPGHALLDLGGLALHALEGAGVPAAGLSRVPDGCTICHPHFESFRRDAEKAGRMLHWITAT